LQTSGTPLVQGFASFEPRIQKRNWEAESAQGETRLLALDAQDFHALIERLPALAAHVKETAQARLAVSAEALKGDIAAEEIAQANRNASWAVRS
jgi:uncharacterized protein (DUF1697 family)